MVLAVGLVQQVLVLERVWVFWLVLGWVGVISLLGSGLNSRCLFMGTQSEQLLFIRQDTLFRGELENADCQVGRCVQQERIGG